MSAPSLTAPARLLVKMVRGYQRRLSPLKAAPTCRFTPTCSEYAAQALEGHGAVKGTLLAASRILRCHPLHPGGYDPVPPPHPTSSERAVSSDRDAPSVQPAPVSQTAPASPQHLTQQHLTQKKRES